MSTPPSPNDLTRQQLDELDSLLQRMLSLPLSPPAEAPAPPMPAPPLPDFPTPPSAGWRADAGGPAQPPHLADELAPAVAPLGAAVEAPQLAAPPPAADWGPDPLARYGTSPPKPAAPPPNPYARLFGPPTPDTGVPPSAGGPPPSTQYEYSLPLQGPSTLRGVDAPALPAGFRSLLGDDEAAEPVPLTPAASPDPSPVAPHAPIPLFLWPVFAANWVLEALLGLLGPVGVIAAHPVAKHLLGLGGVALLAGSAAWAARGMGWITLPWPR